MKDKLKIITAILSVSIVTSVLVDLCNLDFLFSCFREINFMRTICDLIVLAFLLSFFKSGNMKSLSFDADKSILVQDMWVKHFTLRFSVLMAFYVLIYVYSFFSKGSYSEGYFLAIAITSFQVVAGLLLFFEAILLFRNKSFNNLIVNACLILLMVFISKSYYR
ncbi:hypothetical protein NAT51_07210 [Flavobacterium amniphilum]|uniref:hypothetical protein n=1 Tax=Flavobacterium amniphilum TaxID=1834035 RepID=UPI00202A3BD1|nr:hypothetical protein [Flavobacterium amniphilum]MCL9805303.1 hypothetical protein [Flavobacterium amniphilum]